LRGRLKIRWDGLVALLSFLFLAGALVGGICFLKKTPESVLAVPSGSFKKQLDRELMRGARVFSPQQGRLPVVQFESVRIVKPRFGGISLGGFNRLEIDGLKLLWYADSGGEGDPAASNGGFSSVRKLLSVEELCRKAGVSQRVSSVRISSLCLSVFANEKPIQILCAKSAKSVKSGRFRLKECAFLNGELVLHQVPEAELDVRDGVVISGQSVVSLAAVADALVDMQREDF